LFGRRRSPGDKSAKYDATWKTHRVLKILWRVSLVVGFLCGLQGKQPPGTALLGSTYNCMCWAPRGESTFRGLFLDLICASTIPSPPCLKHPESTKTHWKRSVGLAAPPPPSQLYCIAAFDVMATSRASEDMALKAPRPRLLVQTASKPIVYARSLKRDFSCTRQPGDGSESQ